MLSRGSEWQRWEPHIHAPGMVINNQFSGPNAWADYLTATDKPRELSAEGLAEFIIGSARFYSGDIGLTDRRDRRLAEILFLYGKWPLEGPLAIMRDDGIAGVEFVAAPEEPSDQGFDGIGWASRIFMRYFATRTVDGDHGIQLNGAPVPEWFAPLAAWDFKRSQLPLWLFRQQPSIAALPDKEHGSREVGE
jgi:hypothetical protein